VITSRYRVPVSHAGVDQTLRAVTNMRMPTKNPRADTTFTAPLVGFPTTGAGFANFPRSHDEAVKPPKIKMYGVKSTKGVRSIFLVSTAFSA